MNTDRKQLLKTQAEKYFSIYLSFWAGALTNMISVALLGITPLAILYYALYAVTILFSLRAIYLLSFHLFNSEEDALQELKQTILELLEKPLSLKFHIIAFISPIFIGFVLSANIAFFVVGITLSVLSFCLCQIIDDWKDLQPFSFSFGPISIIVMFGITDFLVFFVATFTSSMLALWLLAHLFIENNADPNTNVNMTMMLMFIPVCLSYMISYAIDFLFDFLLQTDNSCSEEFPPMSPIRDTHSEEFKEVLNPYLHFTSVLNASNEVINEFLESSEFKKQ